MLPEETKYEIRIVLSLWQIVLLRNALIAARGIIMLTTGSDHASVIDTIIESLDTFSTVEREKRHGVMLGETIHPPLPEITIEEVS